MKISEMIWVIGYTTLFVTIDQLQAGPTPADVAATPNGEDPSHS